MQIYEYGNIIAIETEYEVRFFYEEDGNLYDYNNCYKDKEGKRVWTSKFDLQNDVQRDHWNYLKYLSKDEDWELIN